MPLNPKARDTIVDMVRRHGPEIVGDARRCEGYLRDFCAAEPLEMNLLIDALRERVPQTLQANANNKLIQAHVPDLVQKLHLHRGMREDFAVWAVEAWATALGVTIRAPATAAGTPQTPAELEFGRAVRFAVQDGVLTRDERRNLDMLRDRLGLDPQWAQQVIADALAAAPPRVAGGGNWAGRVAWLIIGVAVIAGVGVGAMKVLGVAKSGGPGTSMTPSAHASGPTTAAGPTASPTSSGSSPSPARPAATPAVPIDAAVTRLRDRINADRNTVDQRLSELIDLEKSVKQQRDQFDAAVSELDRMQTLLSQAISRAEVENRWPVRVAGQRLSEAQARSAVKTFEQAVAQTKTSIAALDHAFAASQSVQAAGQTYRTQLNNLKARLPAARTEADLAPIADAVARAAADFANTDRASAAAIRPTPPPPVTLDSVFSSLGSGPR